MIDADKRNAIFELHKQGVGTRRIASLLGLSRNAVRDALKSGYRGVPPLQREETLTPHIELVRSLVGRCEGNLVRVHEELTARGIELGYSTLTSFCRRHGLELGRRGKTRTGQYTFEPGEEMQHDTSPHRVVVGGRKIGVQCASLVLCYSRLVFVQIYPRFTRFDCRIFLTDALRYFGGSAQTCMTDNTSVVLAPGGTGPDAIPSPQMAAFAKHFGFQFQAHEVGDANRSARVERRFHYVENNFYVGRVFDDFRDLNRQAVAWCDRVNATFRKRLKASPVELFARERLALTPLPTHIPHVYDIHRRRVDVEGYVHLHTNRYSAPDELIAREVDVREYKNRVVIFNGIRPAAEHPLIPPGRHSRSTLPEHRYKPKTRSRKARPYPGEATLRAVSVEFDALVSALKKRHGGRASRQLKHLHQIWLDYPDDAVLNAVGRALQYGLLDLRRLEQMVLQRVAGDFFRLTRNPEHDDER